MASNLQILSQATRLDVADLSVPCIYPQHGDNDGFYLQEALGRLNESVYSTYLKGAWHEVNSQLCLAIIMTFSTIIAKAV